jgi:hypothetical protein
MCRLSRIEWSDGRPYRLRVLPVAKPSISILTTPSIISCFYAIQMMQFNNTISYAVDQHIRFPYN